ncbi:RNA polymerase sigma factor SigJ [Microlunatus speluncae]|uniref:RNA polymerase sigma factor SigJ n=1 Tax=Microlunatus speluncae TaxID=2594267 RepID=UPI00126650DC|nr:RNA polymerase sigma factor SigJ [Microlunatus speluncae]
METPDPDAGFDPAAEFTRHRRMLFTLAYEILGRAGEVEDVLQDSWLRWSAVDHDRVDNPRAYLARLVSRQALNRLRTVARLREDYVGPWLPEPIRTDGPDPAAELERSDELSVAMLLVLETLTPDERAVFVLHEAFGYPHPEIATALGKSPAAVRQLAHRARSHVQARRPRFTVSAGRARGLAEAFVTAATTGDLDSMVAMLAPDAVQLSDGGGKVSAARRPVRGRDKIARLLAGLATLPGLTYSAVTYNGLPGFEVRRDGLLDTIGLLQVVDRDGALMITDVYLVRNPDKLAHLG